MVLVLSNHPCEACVQAQQAHQARFSREVRADRIFRTVGRPCYQTGRFPTTRNVNTVGPYRPQKLLRLVAEVFPCIPDSQKLFSVPNLSQRPIFWFSGFSYPKNRHVISSLVVFTSRCAAHLAFKSFALIHSCLVATIAPRKLVYDFMHAHVAFCTRYNVTKISAVATMKS